MENQTDYLEETGIPEGNVLGSVLFILYINELLDILEDAILSLLGDDAPEIIKESSIAKISEIDC